VSLILTATPTTSALLVTVVMSGMFTGLVAAVSVLVVLASLVSEAPDHAWIRVPQESPVVPVATPDHDIVGLSFASPVAVLVNT
jgi:hypothetical protein